MMKDLIGRLDGGGYSCVIASGESVRCFEQRGIADLYDLLMGDTEFLRGSIVADKVVGKGAAAIMIKGGVKRLYSHVISDGALQLFEGVENAQNSSQNSSQEGYKIEVEYGRRVPHIINRDGSDWCPVEKLCRDVESLDEILPLIDKFIIENRKK